MKIAITGYGGTGKTTLAEALSSNFGYPLIDEGIREFLQETGIKDLRSMPPEETMKMQWWLLNHKISQEEKLDKFIADRSTIDNIAYVLRWCSRQEGLEQEIDRYIKLAKKYAENTYDLILFLPWGKFKLKEDGIRSVKKWYQYEIDRLLWGLLWKQKVDIYIVKSSSLKERVVEISELLKDKK